MSPSVIIPGFILLFAGLFLTLGILLLRKGEASKRLWRKTTGTVTQFGLKNSLIRLRYRYVVSEKEYEGKAAHITFWRKGVDLSDVTIPPSACVDKWGRLKFVPGREVTVYHHPDNPADSALIPGPPRGVWKMIVIPALIILAVAVFWSFEVAHVVRGVGWAFGGAMLIVFGVIPLWFSLSAFLKHLRSRDWSFTDARVIEASAIEDRTGKNGTVLWRLDLLYEYEVEGIRYTAGQVHALGNLSSSNRSKHEAEAAAYLADPKIRIWYNPRAPWECYLKQGPVLAFLLPGILALGFIIVGLVTIVG